MEAVATLSQDTFPSLISKKNLLKAYWANLPDNNNYYYAEENASSA